MRADQVEEARDLLKLREALIEMNDPNLSGLTVTFGHCDGRGVHPTFSGHPQSKDPVVRNNHPVLLRFFKEIRLHLDQQLESLGVED